MVLIVSTLLVFCDLLTLDASYHRPALHGDVDVAFVVIDREGADPLSECFQQSV